MIAIKNLLFQPLAFPLTGGQSLHLQPRETQEVPDNQISHDLLAAEKRGLIHMETKAGTQSANSKPKPTRRKRKPRA